MESIATVNTLNFILTILLSTISYYKGAKLFTFLMFFWIHDYSVYDYEQVMNLFFV